MRTSRLARRACTALTLKLIRKDTNATLVSVHIAVVVVTSRGGLSGVVECADGVVRVRARARVLAEPSFAAFTAARNIDHAVLHFTLRHNGRNRRGGRCALRVLGLGGVQSKHAVLLLHRIGHGRNATLTVIVIKLASPHLR